MSLKEAEHHIKNFLSILEQKDIESLFQTVCGSKIPFTTASDAIEMILKCSDSSEELLGRKRITKEILFKYLMQERADVSLQKSDKNSLVFQTLKHWRSKQKAVTSLSAIASHALQNQPPAGNIPEAHPASGQAVTYNIVNNVVINQGNGHQPHAPTQSLGVATSQTPHALVGLEYTQLAKEFAEWFYKMLNNCNPCMNAKSDFGPVHFFPNCWMKSVIIMGGQVQESEERGVDAVGQKLLQFVQNEGVLFNPHLDMGGTASKTNIHGMTVVQVCGTLHKNQDVVGVFEQKFGIVKDPSMNFNWRIKFSHLCTKVGVPSEQPALGGEMTTLLPLTES